ncbi:MAG: hypothetical protein DRN18_00075 [Thermoplasmata archaeon]|nr:MAG: hypothetical protein DRN18_00075 [Thermoplasmata archaeon]
MTYTDQRIAQTKENVIKWAKENISSPNIIDRLFAQSILESQKKTESTTASSSKVKGTTSSSPSKPSSSKKTTPPSKGKTDTKKTAPPSKGKTSTEKTTSPPTSQTPPRISIPPTPSYEKSVELYEKGRWIWRSLGITSPEELQEKYEIAKAIRSGEYGRYGEIAIEEAKTKAKSSALAHQFKDFFSRYTTGLKESASIEKKVKEDYNKAINQLKENIDYVMKHGTGLSYEYGGKVWKGGSLVSHLREQIKQLEQEKQQQLEKIRQYRSSLYWSFIKGNLAYGKAFHEIQKYKKSLEELKEKGAFAVKRKEEGELIIYPSKKAYEREQKIEEKIEYLEKKPAPEKLAIPFFSYEYWSGQFKNLYDLFTGKISKEKVKERRRKAYREAIVTVSKIWSGKPIQSITAFSSSPVGVFSTSILGGSLTGLGVGAISRIAPTAGTVTKGLLAGGGIIAGGLTAYDVGRTAIVEKDISKALTKGLVYGISFYGAGKLFKSGYTKGFQKAHVWWTSKYEPTFKQIIPEKILTKEGIAFKGFQEWSYRYSLGRKIHATIHFKGVFAPEKSPQFKPLYASYISTPKGRVLVLEGVLPEGKGITLSKGVGTIRYGILRPKTKIFEIMPEISYGKSGRILRLAIFSGKKGTFGLVSSHSESRFFSLSKEGFSGGRVIFGESKPLRFGEYPVFVESPKYVQRPAWMKGFTASEEFALPTKGFGKIVEPKGFTFRGGRKPSFLTPIKGKPTGKVPLSSLYKTEQLTKIIPPRPPLETGELPPEFKTPLIPILVSKKISIKPFSALKTEPKAYELKGLPKVSTKGGTLFLLPPKLKPKTVQKQKLKLKLIQRQRTKQLQLKKLKLEMKSLSKTKVGSLSLIKTKVSTSLKRKTAPVLKMKQLQGQKLRLRQIVVQKPILRSRLKLRSLSITIPSLKLKGITASKTKLTEISTIPISPPPVGKPKLGLPSGKKVSLTVKRRRGRKTKRRKWRKTLLASPFAVEESYIKFGKATHPKPTKKLWKVGYRTMFKIPTVELMKKGRRKKKGGRKR